MKEYLKPDVEFIKFASEDTTIASGEGGSESSGFSDDDFGA